ncbi:uncharacterized protein LOC126284563 isoform X4 [Schistocerca gregaria]|uniref:uncharacterized protein LOC126284563 isoform X3 n=1 Tax=Schistocerca gregaria TaxID=7010 RepID=UPI00211E81DC|nr:uncharacterized protein LOC126284563 isoform X3 [Schistocerca gregaria]XP_049839529.1 uncharacterized protein LOC126284563 isoform X4 [Schistocerca gregaria]
MHKTLIVIVVVAACVVAISAQVVCPKECLGLAGGSPVTEDKLQSGHHGRNLPRQRRQAPYPASATRAKGSPLDRANNNTEVHNPVYFAFL